VVTVNLILTVANGVADTISWTISRWPRRRIQVERTLLLNRTTFLFAARGRLSGGFPMQRWSRFQSSGSEVVFLHRTSSSGRFTLFRKIGPVTLLSGFDKVNGSRKDVLNARVLRLSVEPTKAFVQTGGVRVLEICRHTHPEASKVFGVGGSDIWNRLEGLRHDAPRCVTNCVKLTSMPP